MNILLSNRETLTQLFKSFNVHEILQLNQTLNNSWHLLITPPEQLLIAMNEKQVSIESFLGKKCLPLIRFYLAERELQKETFLSTLLLGKLFQSLPAVEAMVFKEQIHSALLCVQKSNHALASQLTGEALAGKSLLNSAQQGGQLPLESTEAVLQLNHYKPTNKASLTTLSESDKLYLNCFYYLRAGELFIVADGQTVDDDMLLYSELSPLQQLQAQKLFSSKASGCDSTSIESMAHRSASA